MLLEPAVLAELPDAIARPRYDLADVGPGIVHFGPGAFHRVHQAWYAQRWLAVDRGWGIVEVALHSRGLRDALRAQGGLYTLAILDRRVSYEVIGAIVEVLVAPEAPQEVLARLASPSTRMITLTVTEKGYCLDAGGELDLAHPDVRQDLERPKQPTSVVGYLVEGLRRRREAGLGPVPVLSCDNLTDNGTRLGAAVASLAAQRDPGLAAWIRDQVPFPRTMVDSITPATTDALRAQVEQATGLRDAWPVQREAFVQWVVESHRAAIAPEWAAAGATLTSDVSGFERAKLRLLNGAHSTLAYAGLLRGHDTVESAMQDEELSRFVQHLMTDDIAPTVRPPRGLDVARYIGAVLERFRNPSLRHELSQIAWDGSQKLPFRILGTVRDALDAGANVDRLAVPLAAWMQFVRRRWRDGVAVVDPLAAKLRLIAAATCGDPVGDVGRFLDLREIFPPDLAATPRLRGALERAYAAAERWPSGPVI